MSLENASLSALIMFLPNLNKIIKLIEIDTTNKEISITLINSWYHRDKVRYTKLVYNIISTYYCLMCMSLGIVRMSNYIIFEDSVIFISKLYKIDKTTDIECYKRDILIDMVDFISNELLISLNSEQIRTIDSDGYLFKFLNNEVNWSNYISMIDHDTLRKRCNIIYNYIDDDFLNCINIPKQGIFCILY